RPMKKIFISYSHKDAAFKEQLKEQLEVLKLEKHCDYWVDDQIQTGTDWLPEIKTAIEQADIAVLMVSAGFLTSTFIRGTEIPAILQRRKEEGLTVLPLFVKPCPWKQVAWLKGIQGFPLDGKFLMELKEPEQLRVLTQFTERIHAAINLAHVEPEPEKESDIGNYPGPANKTPRSGARCGARSGARCGVLTSLPPRKIKLIGRENDLAALVERLRKTDRVVLVNGMGGIGKTEVCKSFFHTHYEQYDYAAWIDWVSSLRESLVRALGGEKSIFIKTTGTDTLDERFEKIMDRLRQMKESFLLVVDNIEDERDPDLDALAALPKAVNVLVNSRSVIDGYQLQRLDYLSPGECKALFYQFYTK
ncbi:MAG: toll/interleukin-1 receptor domain-containing protein, partial [Acidobacteria bacterium]|nr:toll/interleukin-1 receptor domain-containing protein [Acidobacteriota bacterium]